MGTLRAHDGDLTIASGGGLHFGREHEHDVEEQNSRMVVVDISATPVSSYSVTVDSRS